MVCAFCKYPHTQVAYTRPMSDDKIQRRRECMRCGRRFNTEEKLEEVKRLKKQDEVK